MSMDSTAELQEAITAIERSYEFMLAYAAQGRDFEDSGTSPSIRESLETLAGALSGIADLVASHAAQQSREEGPVFGEFADVLRRDAARARAAVMVALSLSSIGSQVVDNLNASIHLRALLTDVFLIDEALKAARRTRPNLTPRHGER